MEMNGWLTYFLRGLVIAIVTFIVSIPYYLLYMLFAWLSTQYAAAWVITLLLAIVWLPISFLILGWVATKTVKDWIPTEAELF